MEAVSPERFAANLVECIRPVLPAGFSVRAEGDLVSVEAPDGTGASTSMSHLDPAGTGPEDYADAAWNVLSLVQDVVSETAADPWPASGGSPTELAEPGTRVEGVTVALYFGDEQQPVLTLRPVPFE